MTKFEVGQFYGNDLTIEVIKRTAKFITIKTSAWGEKRVKIDPYNGQTEAIYFKCWEVLATEKFDSETAKQISYEKAYLS